MRKSLITLGGLLLVVLAAAPIFAVKLQLQLPLGRTAYQTNEQIDVALVRADTQALTASDLTMTVSGQDASVLTFTFPLAAAPLDGQEARTTDNLRLNGWLLRPGHYTLTAQVYGQSASTEIEVYSFLRKSTFKLIDWGSRGQGAGKTALGEDGMGFNLLYANGGDDAIRGGLDFMGCCVMGGGHQMDLRMECDWSDPYVLTAAQGRVTKAALQYRTQPNALGVHFYDEPGLTWWLDPVTKEMTAHNVPAQDRAYKSAFGKDPLQYNEVNPNDPESAARWQQWATWKLGFMDAAWKYGQFGVSYVRPDFLSVTQSQYGWYAFTDGYYFNVARSLPVVSGHGGYDDGMLRMLTPSYYLTMARARDMAKPCWYLPTWYGNTAANTYRAEQYASFITGLQGMAKPPDMGVQNPSATPPAAGIVETNKTMAKLGTIFTTMPPSRSSVALLYSLSHLIHAQTKDRALYYASADPHGAQLMYAYLACNHLHYAPQAVVDEDVLDGTLQAEYRAVILPAITYLDPREIAKLEEFINCGGLVLKVAGTTVPIKGAVDIDIISRLPDQDKVDALYKEKKYMEAAPYTGLIQMNIGVAPLEKALKAALEKAEIPLTLACNQPGIVVARHSRGDIEYLFAVNVTPGDDPKDSNSVAPVTAAISLPNDGRFVYDAVRGGAVPEYAGIAKGRPMTADFHFGPGEMRAFARTTRPIGGVLVTTPVISRDYTRAAMPLTVQVNAELVDTKDRVLAGSVPLLITLTDPLGDVRYALYRATDQGICALTLPLAANDPPGQWRITVSELLSQTSGVATFTLAPTIDCGELAGATCRAVIFGDDANNIYRFFRVHREITIVKGTGAYQQAAAERLAASMKPWNVSCTIVNAADVKPRELSADEAKTWCGIDYMPRGTIKAGSGNSPALVGYALPGAVILLGTPQDNVVMRTVANHNVLPYKIGADFPPRDRGMLAWQYDIVGKDLESLCVIAGNEAGMSEAIGTLYETATGLLPLTPLIMPATLLITPAGKAMAKPALALVWNTVLNDRAAWLRAEGNSTVLVCTLDGLLTTLTADGKIRGVQQMKSGEQVSKADTSVGDIPKDKLAPYRVVKAVVKNKDITAIAYWGGTLQTFTAGGQEKSCQLLSNDIAALAINGNTLVVGLADGKVLGLRL